MTPIRSGFARTEDGLHLYYRVIGEGPPLVCCNGVGVSTFFFKYIVEHYRDRFSVVLWDYRGHGRSGTPADIINADLSVERCADDLRLVLEQLDMLEPSILLGHSMGCQVILEFANRYPELTGGLVPMFGTFGRPLDTFFDFSKSRAIFDVLYKVAALGGRSGTRMMLPLYASPLAFKVGGLTGLVDRHYALEQDIRKYLEHLLHMDTRVFLRMVSLLADHDLTDVLPDIKVPALVIAAEKDVFTPLHRSRLMAELLPNSELMILAEGSHAAIVEHPQTINRRIDRFLDRI